MRYRGFALMIVAAGVSLNSAALANPHCRVGTIYYRSKHTCLAKEVAIDRGFYHYRHDIAAKPDGTTIVYRGARACGRAGGGNSRPAHSACAQWYGSGAKRECCQHRLHCTARARNRAAIDVALWCAGTGDAHRVRFCRFCWDGARQV